MRRVLKLKRYLFSTNFFNLELFIFYTFKKSRNVFNLALLKSVVCNAFLRRVFVGCIVDYLIKWGEGLPYNKHVFFAVFLQSTEPFVRESHSHLGLPGESRKGGGGGKFLIYIT